MVKNARPLWNKLSQLRRSYKKNSVVDKNEAKHKKARPVWVGRVVSVMIDLGFFSLIMGASLGPLLQAFGETVSLLPLALFPVYYLISELLFGRTLGKVVMGYKIGTQSGSLGPLLFRGLVRLIPVVNFAFLLSWRRVTVLDLLSGTRVWNGKRLDPKNPRRIARPSSSLQRHAGGRLPKGFEEGDLER